MKRVVLYAISLFLFGLSSLNMRAEGCQTQVMYFSGHGSDDPVQWDFYCTDGRNSGKWTKIGVPSCWETQGFGITQYGFDYNIWNMYPSTKPIADETGYYRYTFKIPHDWNDKHVEIVFEAAMTDTEVKINGIVAGAVHQGGFSPFRFNITSLLYHDGKENTLEVKVNKESSNHTMNLAQRRCDFWNFGGIIRPVYLVAKPQNHIERVAINADMNGVFHANCYVKNAGAGWKLQTTILDSDGKLVRDVTEVRISQSEEGSTPVSICQQVKRPKLWTAETPYLYTAVFSLVGVRGNIVHQVIEKFGFRTIEVRERDGVFLNGKRIMFKGVNRDSFHPETGRTLSKQKNIDDVVLIKSMNMNAVRLNDYPADTEFYDACDSLGLYVLAELSGWQTPQETHIGKRLVREMVTRDVNHPSIIFWCSGNEGGFNYELEPEFRKYDIQKRTILYPWSETKNGICTRHYRTYEEVKSYLESGDIYMPTEFLHGLYDGGIGAGLSDYWQLMKRYPNSAGGFLWCLTDEGLVRNDWDGKIDCQGNLAADGVVGPHHEKEGSYFTVKELWSPIQLTYKDGNLKIENAYDFRTLEGCKILCQWLEMPWPSDTLAKVLMEKTIHCTAIMPKQCCEVKLPIQKAADALRLTAYSAEGDSLFTWCQRIRHKSPMADCHKVVEKLNVFHTIDRLNLAVKNMVYSFSETNGQLKQLKVDGKTLHFGNGPRFIAARRADRGRQSVAKGSLKDFRLYLDDAKFSGFTVEDSGITCHYKDGYLKDVKWSFLADGNVTVKVRYYFNRVVDLMGIMFDYPENQVLSKRWVGNGPYRVWQNRLLGPQHGYWYNDYNNPVPGQTFHYPEFKGYFSQVDWMQIETTEGTIGIVNADSDNFVGIYAPEDGLDQMLYRLPDTGISILQVIPAVRTKVHYSDELGPSAQPHVATGDYECEFMLMFSE